MIKSQINIYKSDIKLFKERLDKMKKLPKENDINSIIKKVLFLKILLEKTENKHYASCMIYNMLNLIYSLTKNSQLNFYYSYRSFIENLIRVKLEYGDKNDTGVRKMFDEFQAHCEETDNISFFNYIKSEYKVGCDYVHSNINGLKEIHLYLDEIINSDEMEGKKLESIIIKLNTMLTQCVKLYINENTKQIDNIFYRKSYLINYLIGDRLYKIYQEKINE